MAWMIREDQLDPEQREFINTESQRPGNIWIQGFAGSGKSILLVHTLRGILKKEPKAKAIIVVFTHSLIDLFKTGLKELKINVPVVTYHAFKKGGEFYDYILCDEVQDLPEDVLLQMSRRGRRVLVAGDSNQSIYEGTVSPNDIGRCIYARPYTLTMIHRLTQSIIGAVQKLLPSMNIFGAKRDLTKQDVSIRLCKADTPEEEYQYVYTEALKGARIGEISAVLFHSHEAIINFVNLLLKKEHKPEWIQEINGWGKPDFNKLNRHSQGYGLSLEYVGNNYGSLENAVSNHRIILMTYHSSKGLDFDNVFLPNQDSRLNLKSERADAVYMVAITRSKKNLYLSYQERSPHSYVQRFMSDCTKIDVSKANQPSGIDFDF